MVQIKLLIKHLEIQIKITALQHQQRSLLSSFSFPLLWIHTCDLLQWWCMAGKAETTCLICKCRRLANGVAIGYSATRHRPWKKQSARCKRQLCSKPREGGRIDRTCKYGVEIQIRWDERGEKKRWRKRELQDRSYMHCFVEVFRWRSLFSQFY